MLVTPSGIVRPFIFVPAKAYAPTLVSFLGRVSFCLMGTLLKALLPMVMRVLGNFTEV